MDCIICRENCRQRWEAAVSDLRAEVELLRRLLGDVRDACASRTYSTETGVIRQCACGSHVGDIVRGNR